MKEILYCNDHKLDKMVNVKKVIFYVKNMIFLIQIFVKNANKLIVCYVTKR